MMATQQIIPVDGGDLDDAVDRLGLLTDEQAAQVRGHAAERGIGFDAAAVELGLVAPGEVERARSRLAGSLALRAAPRPSVSDEIVVISDPSSAKAEAIRLLRTSIIAQHLKQGRRALAVTSAVDGVGCSFIAANLAAALSQVGIKTLLVDCNLRAPRLFQPFGINPNGPGLTSYLSFEVNRPERVVQPEVLPNLSVIPAGPPVARPQELLSNARFRDGINILLREYDIAIFDTPPTSDYADALTVAGAVGYTLAVGRRNHSYVNDIRALSQQLADARSVLIGSVLTEFD